MIENLRRVFEEEKAQWRRVTQSGGLVTVHRVDWPEWRKRGQGGGGIGGPSYSDLSVTDANKIIIDWCFHAMDFYLCRLAWTDAELLAARMHLNEGPEEVRKALDAAWKERVK